MGRYLVLLYGREMRRPRRVTKEMIEAGMRPWREYTKSLARGERMEGGAPVSWKGRIMEGRGAARAYSPRGIDLVGYMIIRARSMPEAERIARRSPHADMGGTSTVREIMEVPI